NEVSEEVILDAIMFGHQEVVRLVEFQEKIVQAVSREKFAVEVFEVDESIFNQVKKQAYDQLTEAIRLVEKHAREERIDAIKADVLAEYDEDDEEVYLQVKHALEE